MSEPQEKDSPAWRDWYVRYTFGGTFVETIKITAGDNGSLNTLIKFINDVQQELRSK